MTAIVGHDEPATAFDTARRSGALHHAWLLAGPQGVGKGSFAREAAIALIGDTPRTRSLVAAGSHPDHLLIEREVWTSTSPPRIVPQDERKDGDTPARSIRVPQVRWLRSKLTTPPALGARRAVIIDAVDDLEREGANALLKTLEEPPAGTIFLLVSHAPGQLLPTIRSRCRLLRFGRLSPDDTRAVIARALPETSSREIEVLSDAADGVPGEALRFAGLDLAAIDASLATLIAEGDAANALRSRLAQQLAGKAAQPRYEAFLDRAVAATAGVARRETGAGLVRALDAHAAARDLAGAAIGLSLDPAATVFEMAGIVAGLARRAA